MKREGHLFEKIITMENLILADRKARKNKKNSYGVTLFDRRRGCNFISLQMDLLVGSYQTPDYSVFKVYEPKEREIYRLPYRDRIVHHAIMNILEPIWVSVFSKDTYSCIKGRGVHKAAKEARKAMQKDPYGSKYALKLDIRKFYPSIDHNTLKSIIRKRIKCPGTLELLDGIIDSAPGVPIGNYLSQFFANLYLAYFDHAVKEKLRVRHYFRYADDIVVLGSCKQHLHKTLAEMRVMLSDLKLEIKGNYQVFPVEARGLDFVGYVIRKDYVRLRKSIKKKFAKSVAKGKGYGTPSWWSYKGWADHCDSKHLIKKLTELSNIKSTA